MNSTKLTLVLSTIVNLYACKILYFNSLHRISNMLQWLYDNEKNCLGGLLQDCQDNHCKIDE